MAKEESIRLDRRQLLQCAAVIASGATATPRAWSITQQQAAYIDANKSKQLTPTLFSPVERKTVAAIAEHVIPETETPGAISAGADRFIELMVQHWFTLNERSDFLKGLKDIEQQGERLFIELSANIQRKLLEELEDNADDSDWFNLGNVMRTWDSSAPFICQIKELTVLGFMLSEVGSNQFLQPNPMGVFNGEINESAKSSYAAQIPIRVMQKGS